MVESKDKYWIIGGAVALVGAALVWSAWNEEEDENENESKELHGDSPTGVLTEDEIMNELKFRKLDVVKYDDKNPGLLETRYFLELMNYIGVSTDKKLKSSRDE